MQGLGRRARLLAAALAVACVAAASAQAGTAGSGSGSGAGGAVPSCAAKLVPCAAYLNSTSAPPAACCAPLKEAAANETACMCAMLLNKAALQAFGVAPEQGLGLAKRCGVTTDASACAKSATTAATAGAGAATGSGAAASSASTGGSASTVTKPTANGGVVRHRLSLTDASALAGFSFIWWAIMA